MNEEETPSLIEGHAPTREEVQYAIGPYQILNSLGKGGMGEVLLAYDTSYGRRIALKKIRADLAEHTQMHNRFLREAKITCQLTHPAIIPIYVIEDQDNTVHYTMPYIQGETLKQILRKTRKQEKKGEPLDHLGGSIPALIRVFITVCQAVAYAHDKGVLHRDLKPENIMIGAYGEVYILDWGLAKLIGQQEEEMEEVQGQKQELTRIGKVVGTVTYMAPERARGNPASISTDIYSLGVILFQLLTLQNPFKRGTLKEFRKSMHTEELQDPIEMAPYRDIPPVLSRIALKCLDKEPDNRYRSVDELIRELENYIEGRSEWFQIAELQPEEKSDWEFQEHVLIAEHIAITQTAEASEWVNLMISKASFSENIRIEAMVKVDEESLGIGFLLCVPEAGERIHLNDGYCVWIGTEKNPSTKLLRSAVEVLHAPEVCLNPAEWNRVRIEKIDNNLYFYLNDALQFSYISHLPLVGTHVGLLSRDAHFSIEDLLISVKSLDINVNCLAVPDAFLAHKEYVCALNEYRRIGYSFPGRAEGREAMFRAGITLLEQGKSARKSDEKNRYLEAALKEFEKLHSTPGAPLEYLGKSLVYKAQNNREEEIKCYELSLRRFRKHPLIPILLEHILYRMHETSRTDRKTTYQLLLILLRHEPNNAFSSGTQALINRVQGHWERLPFIQEPREYPDIRHRNHHIATLLSFWTGKTYILEEIIHDVKEEKSRQPYFQNGILALVALGDAKTASAHASDSPLLKGVLDMEAFSLQEEFEKGLKQALTLSAQDQKILLFLMLEKCLSNQWTDPIPQIAELLGPSIEADAALVHALLLEKNWKEAGKVFERRSLSDLTSDTSPLHPLYGCWLAAVESKEISDLHFSGILSIPFPRTWTLLSHYLAGHIGDIWMEKAFLWEKRHLFRQLHLYYRCLGDDEKARLFKKKEREA